MSQQKTIQQVIRYLWMTLLSAGLTLALPILFHEVLGLSKETAVALALATSFIVNFFTVRIVVFRSSGNPTSEFVRYALTNASFRLGEFLLFLIFHTILEIYYIVVLGFVLGLSFILKFILYRYLVFKAPASGPGEIPGRGSSRWG